MRDEGLHERRDCVTSPSLTSDRAPSSRSAVDSARGPSAVVAPACPGCESPSVAPVPCEEPRCERPTRFTATGSLRCIVRRVRGAGVCNGSNPRARCGRTAARGGSRRGYYRSLFLAISRRALVLRAATTSDERPYGTVPPPPAPAAPDPAPTPAQWLREGKCTVLCSMVQKGTQN